MKRGNPKLLLKLGITLWNLFNSYIAATRGRYIFNEKHITHKPMQMALASDTLSNEEVKPAPLLAMAVESPIQGLVLLPTLSDPVKIFFSSRAARRRSINECYWETLLAMEFYGNAG